MNRHTRPLYGVLSTLLVLTACGEKPAPEAAEVTSVVSSEKPTEVSVVPIKLDVFNDELISNGTLMAARKADLSFQSNEVVAGILVKNGDRVVKGQALASLEDFNLKQALAQANDSYQRARLELQDVLIGQGYSLEAEAAIPPEVLKIAKVRSNFEQARLSLEMAEHNLKVATLYAPFNGVVANLTTKVHNKPDGSKAFCTILDMEHPEVQFNILENELTRVKAGDAVLVSPFSNDEKVSKGRITEVNPVIDKNGMVMVKARLEQAQPGLFDGMNVRVRVQRATDRQLMIPKSALVLRNNRKVVFTSKEGRAQWVYVQTSLENSTSYVVTEGLNEGDSVIFEGNINLAHESPIIVR